MTDNGGDHHVCLFVQMDCPHRDGVIAMASLRRSFLRCSRRYSVRAFPARWSPAANMTRTSTPCRPSTAAAAL